jgi:hypothetical protein
VAKAEAALAEEARAVAPFDRRALMGRLPVDDVRADFGAMGLGMRRTAHEAAHVGIGVHRQDGIDVVERPRPRPQTWSRQHMHGH